MQVTPRGMSLKIYMANKYDWPNTVIRLIVAVLPKLVGNTITTQQFDPFQIANAGICGNECLDINKIIFLSLLNSNDYSNIKYFLLY